MDLLGPSLSDFVYERGGKLALRNICEIARQAIALLEKVHDAGFLHRDVKPANLLFGCRDGDARYTLHLADFGLSVDYWEEADETPLVPGSSVSKREWRNEGFYGTLEYASQSALEGNRKLFFFVFVTKLLLLSFFVPRYRLKS